MEGFLFLTVYIKKLSKRITEFNFVPKINKVDVPKFLSVIGVENLEKQIELGNKSILSYWTDFALIPKINIAIAASVTSYARGFMAQFNQNQNTILIQITDHST